MHLARSLLTLLLPGTVAAVACHPSPYDISTTQRDLETVRRHAAQTKRDFTVRENAEPHWPIDALLSGHRVQPAQAILRIKIDDINL